MTINVMRISELARASNIFEPASSDCSWNGVYNLGMKTESVEIPFPDKESLAYK